MFLSIWGKDFADTIAANAKTTRGQLILALPILAISLGVGAVSWRVAGATEDDFSAPPGLLPDTYPSYDKPAPELGLVNQNGATVTLSEFSGQNFLVTFAFGNCEAICPMVVHDVRGARAKVREAGTDVALVVITLDPWRDTPSRLQQLANQWELGEGAHVLGGSVDQVNAVLDAWEVPRSREPANGNIIHPRLTFVVDKTGRIAYAVSAGSDAIADLVFRLE